MRKRRLLQEGRVASSEVSGIWLLHLCESKGKEEPLGALENCIHVIEGGS